MTRIDNTDLVRSEYSTDTRLEDRFRIFREWRVGGSIDDEILDIVRQVVAQEKPRILEVGCGAGAFSAAMRDRLGARVTACDLSPNMVGLAARRGLDAQVIDVQSMPFPDGSFDIVVASWMLYHVPDFSRGVEEIARVLTPEGSLVAATMATGGLRELWNLVGGDAGVEPNIDFNRDTGVDMLSPWFASVRRMDIPVTVVFPDRDAVLRYIRATLTRVHLADRLPAFDGTLTATMMTSVFVATGPRYTART